MGKKNNIAQTLDAAAAHLLVEAESEPANAGHMRVIAARLQIRAFEFETNPRFSQLSGSGAAPVSMVMP